MAPQAAVVLVGNPSLDPAFRVRRGRESSFGLMTSRARRATRPTPEHISVPCGHGADISRRRKRALRGVRRPLRPALSRDAGDFWEHTRESGENADRDDRSGRGAQRAAESSSADARGIRQRPSSRQQFSTTCTQPVKTGLGAHQAKQQYDGTMSWEEISSKTNTCPCGAGHYTVRTLMDDWNRIEQRWTMDCPRCQSQYSLYTYEVFDSGMTNTSFAWAPRSALEELATLRALVLSEQQRFADYLQHQHGPSWSAHFSGKSKRSIWEELTDAGREYPSLPTFYQHCRRSGLDRVLKDYLQYRTAGTVARVLSLSDGELSEQVSNIQDLETMSARKERHIRRDLAFRYRSLSHNGSDLFRLARLPSGLYSPPPAAPRAAARHGHPVTIPRAA